MKLSQAKKQLLLEAKNYCDAKDKSTEFMLQYMQDFADVDHDTVIHFLTVGTHASFKPAGNPKPKGQKRPAYGHASRSSAFNGVLMWMYKNQTDQMAHCKNANQSFAYANDQMVKFLQHINIKHEDGQSDKSRSFNANKVQDHWKAFIKFIKSQNQ